MKISERIAEDIKDAMRAREKEKLEALRAAKTAFTLAKTSEGSGGNISEDEEIKIIGKLVKQRRESADIYKTQNRMDLYSKEILEAEVLEKYLPAKLGPDQLKSHISTIISKAGASGIKDMGKVMGIASKELAGKADGRDIADMVKNLLQAP